MVHPANLLGFRHAVATVDMHASPLSAPSGAFRAMTAGGPKAELLNGVSPTMTESILNAWACGDPLECMSLRFGISPEGILMLVWRAFQEGDLRARGNVVTGGDDPESNETDSASESHCCPDVMDCQLACIAEKEIERLRDALRLIADFRPTPDECQPPHSQIAVFARRTAKEALANDK